MIKNIYMYLISFVMLVMVIGGSVGMFGAIADLLAPQPYYENFESYKNNNKSIFNDKGEVTETRSDSELLTSYDILAADYEDRQKSNAVNSLIKSFGWVIIPLPVFCLFQRRIREQNASTVATKDPKVGV